MLVLDEGLDPILWTGPYFHVKPKHINIVLLWLFLVMVHGFSVHDMYRRARLRQTGYYPWYALIAAGALMYHFWLIWYIYDQWVQHLIIAVKLLFICPVVAVLTHTLYQMYFLSTTRSLRHIEDHTFFVWINAAPNLVMLVHLVTIVFMACQGTCSWQLCTGFVLEAFCRLYSLVRYYQLYVNNANINLKINDNNVNDNNNRFAEQDVDDTYGKHELVLANNSYTRSASNDVLYLCPAHQATAPWPAYVCCPFMPHPSDVLRVPFTVTYQEGHKILSSCSDPVLLEYVAALAAIDLPEGEHVLVLYKQQ